MNVKVSNSNTPNWKVVTVKSHIPEALKKLDEIAFGGPGTQKGWICSVRLTRNCGMKWTKIRLNCSAASAISA